MKNFLNFIGAWTVKHHWIFLLLIFGLQWLTGEVMSNPKTWMWLMNGRLARQLHALNGQVIFWVLIYMAVNKLWLSLKRKGKI
jgi:hypothetical protein